MCEHHMLTQNHVGTLRLIFVAIERLKGRGEREQVVSRTMGLGEEWKRVHGPIV